MNIWLVSDTHFGHQMLITHNIRPHDYEKRILDNWFRNVKEGDVVIHLGDVAFKYSTELGSTFRELPGYKTLVKGNHDGGYEKYYRVGFHSVVNRMELKIFGKHIIFTHEPAKDVTYMGPNSINLHGHLHGDNHRLQDDLKWYLDRPKSKYLDMSADCWDFELVTLEKVVDKLNKEVQEKRQLNLDY